MKEFDAIIIGTGQAGPPLAASLSKNGYKIAIIEKAHLGGTCVNNGCTPTKAYVASARRAYIAGNSEEMGVETKGEVKVNLKKIKERKDNLVNESRSGLRKMFEEDENITLIRGKAKFIDSYRIEVDDEECAAAKIFINVGGRAKIPEGFENVDYLTNESILELEEVPEHLIIVGGGYVELEFGQMFRRFGSRVTILEHGDQLLKKEDQDISEGISKILKDEGIEIKLLSKCISAKKTADGVKIEFKNNEKEASIEGSHVLLGVGRIPNTDDLGLEKAGVEMDKKNYIRVNDELQTNLNHIWAMGDCNGQGAFTHTAYNDFQIVNSQLFGKDKKFLSDRFMCYAAYIDPALARVGMNEKEIRKKGLKAKVAAMSMSDISRAKEMGETQGHLKIFIDSESEKILGASFLGARADEIIHSVIDMMYAGVSYKVVRDAVHIHPTISELIPTMLQDLKDLDSSN